MALFGSAKAPAVPSHDVGTTVEALTDDSGGTAAETIADIAGLTVSASPTQAEVEAIRDAAADAVASLAQKLSDLIDHLNDGRTSF